MSTTNAPAYCEETDVQDALQENDAKMTESLGTAKVEAAIFGVSRWLRAKADTHWYDSNAASADLISTTAQTTTDHTVDAPSSPHAQQGQIIRSSDHAATDIRYPVTHAGQYVRIKLPKNHVESIDRLAVRDRGGETEDWVAGSQTQGRGEDYYLETRGGVRGNSYLYVHQASLGPHYDFTDIAQIDLTYGQDWDDEPWDDVRRGTAALAAAQLIVEDDVLTQVSESGSFLNVETKAQRLVNQAMSEPGYLAEYLAAPVR
jgi:hypothetical protein